MLRIKFLAMALLLLLPVLCHAGDESTRPKTDANITGHIIDLNNKEHIPYATIGIDGKSLGTAADDTGHYMLKDVPEGEYTITVRYAGYEPSSQNIKISKGQTYILNFEIKASPLTADQVVVTANRYATKKREAATIVNVVSPKLFESTAAVSPAGVLDFQPGLRMEYNCGNCGLPQLRINGLEGQYSQVLLDSRPIFSSLGMVYSLEQLPASMIERLEIIRGGGSALFGSNAIGGIVNIITKEPTRSSIQLSNQSMLIGGKSPDISTSLNASLVSDDLRTGVYLFGMIRDRKHYDYTGDGFSDIPSIGNETIGFRGYQKIGKRSKITAEYHHIQEERRGGDRYDLPPHQANIAEQLTHRIDGGSIQWDYNAGNNIVSVYSAMQNINRDSYFGTNQNPDAYGKTKDLTVNAGAQWTHSFDRLWFMPATFTAGAEINFNDLHDKMLGYNRDIKQLSQTLGAYAQNEWRNYNWTILLGARIDKNNFISHPIISPRITLRYAASDLISFRGGYARGFRAPQVYDEDLHVAAVGGEVALIVVDPNLRPEFSNTYNFSLDLFKVIGTWQLNFLAEGFLTDLHDVFTLTEVGRDDKGNLLLERRNASGARVAGVNLEMRVTNGDRLNIQAGYTLQKSRYKTPFKWSDNVEPQRRMFRSPDSYGYISADYRPWKPFAINANLTYTGPMLLQHYKGYISADTEVVSKQFFDLSCKLSYDIPVRSKLKIQLNAGVKNIFNQFQNDIDQGLEKDSKYFYGPALPRSYFAGVKFIL